MIDEDVKRDVVMLLDLLDAIDWEAPKWHHMIALGNFAMRVRLALGAVDRIPDERLHTNDEQVLDLAFERLNFP